MLHEIINGRNNNSKKIEREKANFALSCISCFMAYDNNTAMDTGVVEVEIKNEKDLQRS